MARTAVHLAALTALLLVAMPAAAGESIGGASPAGMCREPRCMPDCGDAAAKAARLRARLDELRTSEGVIGQRAADARAQASRSYSSMTRPGGSAGNFSREYGGMADVHESLSSGRTDSLADLADTIDDVVRAGSTASGVRQAIAPVTTDVTKTRDLMTTAERYDAQVNDVRSAIRDLEQELAALERECGAAAAGSSGPPAGGPQGGPGTSPGGGGGGGGGGAQGRPPQAQATPPVQKLDEILGYLVRLEPASRRLADLAATTLPLLEDIAKSAEAAADPQRRAQILAGAASHVSAIRSQADETVTLGRDALAILSGGRR